MKNNKLMDILEKHAKWLNGDPEGRKANLSGADLSGANLLGAKNMYIPLRCPSEGAFIGFKKAVAMDGEPVLIKLQIPEDALRSSATSRKCRCDKAVVLSIEDLTDPRRVVTKAISMYDHDFVYETGLTVSVSDFDKNRYEECSTGIHFFIDKQEAINYYI